MSHDHRNRKEVPDAYAAEQREINLQQATVQAFEAIAEEQARAFGISPRPQIKWVGPTWKRTAGAKPRYGVVIHAMWGSYAGSIDWNKNSDLQADAHFYVRRSDGEISQLVGEDDGAWGTRYFLPRPLTGEAMFHIEHEDNQQMNQPGWASEAMLHSSARLTAYLCTRYQIPIDRQHIRGHNEMPGNDHGDPGKFWPWDLYISLVKKYAGEAGGGTGPWASWINLAVDSEADTKYADAARAALKVAGFSKAGVTRNVGKAVDDAIEGALGVFPCVLIGRDAFELLTDAQKRAVMSDVEGGIFYPPAESDVWNAIGETPGQTEKLIGDHLSRICKRMGLDEKKASKVWAEELAKIRKPSEPENPQEPARASWKIPDGADPKVEADVVRGVSVVGTYSPKAPAR